MPAELADADWLFEGFKSHRELRACLLWECARELPFIANWLDRLGAKPSVAEKTAARTAIDKKLGALPTTEFAKYFPGKQDAITALQIAGIVESQGQRAWSKLDRFEREDFVNLIWPRALNTQPLRTEASIRGVAAGLLSDWKRIGDQPRLGPHSNPRAGLVVVQLTPYSWSGFDKEDVIAEFTQMLDSEEWAPIPPAKRWKGKRRGFSETNIRMFLDELGVMRLMHAYSHRAAGKILRAKGFGSGARDCTDKARRSVFEQLIGFEAEVTPPGTWNRHRRQFMRRFRSLFGLDPIAFPLHDSSWATRNQSKEK